MATSGRGLLQLRVAVTLNAQIEKRDGLFVPLLLPKKVKRGQV